MISGITLAIIAQAAIAVSLIADKVLLGPKEGKNTASYVFWIGAINVFGLLLIPFGFAVPSVKAILLAFLGGIAFMAMLWFYYQALDKGGVSNTLPIIGGFAPIATLLLGNTIGILQMNVAEKTAFVLLALGGLILFFSERFDLKKILPLVILAAFFTGVSDILQRLVFMETNFVTGFVMIKFFSALTIAAFLLFPKIRRQILSTSKSATRDYKALYFINRLLAAGGSFLIFYSLSIDPQPSIIEATTGARYVLLIIFAGILSKFGPKLVKEKFSGWVLVAKISAIILILIGLLGISLQRQYELVPFPESNNVTWGVTFSTLMAKQMGMDWKPAYEAILSDLKPKVVRLVAYWDEIEKENGKFDFSMLDEQVRLASEHKTSVVLTVGERVPRWPECHIPSWVDTTNADQTHNYLLTYVLTAVNRFKSSSNLLYWQIENEPYLIFGECPKFDAKTLDRELAEVRAADPKHKILLTDGGEFGDWYRAASKADVFGSTLYRKVHTNLFGYITYPITPEFYGLHKDVTKFLTGNKSQEYIISELGLEPWMVKQIQEVPYSEQLSFFNIDDFNNVVSYARQTKFTTFYTWGAEWWYWLKTTQNDSRFWDAAKELFASGKQ